MAQSGSDGVAVPSRIMSQLSGGTALALTRGSGVYVEQGCSFVVPAELMTLLKLVPLVTVGLTLRLVSTGPPAASGPAVTLSIVSTVPAGADQSPAVSRTRSQMMWSPLGRPVSE